LPDRFHPKQNGSAVVMKGENDMKAVIFNSGLANRMGDST